MTYTDIINKVSKDTNIPIEVVDKSYKAFWLYIRNSVQELPLKEELTEAEFLNLKTNFNIPSLGKLACTYKRYLGVKEKFNYIKKIRGNEEVKKD
jgi:hypothetical protein